MGHAQQTRMCLMEFIKEYQEGPRKADDHELAGTSELANSHYGISILTDDPRPAGTEESGMWWSSRRWEVVEGKVEVEVVVEVVEVEVEVELVVMEAVEVKAEVVEVVEVEVEVVVMEVVEVEAEAVEMVGPLAETTDALAFETDPLEAQRSEPHERTTLRLRLVRDPLTTCDPNNHSESGGA